VLGVVNFKYKPNVNNSKVLQMKGISPVIATILLVGITVGVIIIVNIWFPGLIGSQTETIETSSESFTKCAATTLNIDSAKYYSTGTSRIVNVTITTSGSQNLKNVTITVAGAGGSTVSTKFYNQTGDDLVPGLNFATSINVTSNVSSLPPEIVTVAASCQQTFIITDTCKSGESCMRSG
jgi:flagellin-like protein